MRDSLDDLKKNKKNSFKPLKYKNETDTEIQIEDIYKPESPLDMPIRPQWFYSIHLNIFCLKFI